LEDAGSKAKVTTTLKQFRRRGKTMKVKTSLIAICLLSLLSFGAFADDHDKMLKEHFEFTSDVMVGGTLVKAGRYLIKYNTEKGMVKVINEADDKKVVATAKATVRMNDKTYERDEIVTKNTSGSMLLTGLRLGGQKEEITLTDTMTSSND
jgi:hypothetical protein